MDFPSLSGGTISSTSKKNTIGLAEMDVYVCLLLLCVSYAL